MTLQEAIKEEFALIKDRLADIVQAEAGDILEIVEGDGYRVRWRKSSESVEIASFKLTKSLQCSGIAVPFNAVVNPEFRGSGIGNLLHELRLNAARRAGYQRMLATTRLNNDAQNRIMQRFGWEQIDTFINPRTGNEVILWKVNLA